MTVLMVLTNQKYRYFKRKILYLYNNNNKLEEMSLNAHEKAQSNLSWENYGNKIINTYLNLFNHHKNEKNSSSN